MRYETLKQRAEEYGREELGWPKAEAVEAKAAGTDGRGVAVLTRLEDPERGLSIHAVLLYDEWDALATDAGEPTDFGWSAD